MDPDVANWLRSAEYDASVADGLLRIGKTLYVVFACQQAVEKALKAVVAARLGAHPPRTHDLLALARAADPDAERRFLPLLTVLNQSFLEVRYPLDVEAAERTFPMERVAPLVAQAREVIEWARSRLA